MTTPTSKIAPDEKTQPLGLSYFAQQNGQLRNKVRELTDELNRSKWAYNDALRRLNGLPDGIVMLTNLSHARQVGLDGISAKFWLFDTPVDTQPLAEVEFSLTDRRFVIRYRGSQPFQIVHGDDLDETYQFSIETQLTIQRWIDEMRIANGNLAADPFVLEERITAFCGW